MIKLFQLKYAALITSFAFQAGCSDSDQVSSTSSELVTLPEIRNYMNHKCLEIFGSNNSNGAHVDMWECSGGPNQKWYWNGEEIRNYMNNKCLEILGANNSNGAQVGMWECSGNVNQHWYWQGTQIKSRFNHRCLEILGANDATGAQVVVWECGGLLNQQWY